MDDAVSQISMYASIAGGILLLTFLFSLSICGGIPKNEEQSANEQKYVNDVGNELGTNPTKPQSMY